MLILDLGVPAFAWSWTFLKANTLRRGWRDRRVASLWLFALCFALATTFRADSYHTHLVFQVSNIQELDRLLSYLFIIPAIYLVCSHAYSITKTQPPRWLPLYPLVTSAFVLATYPWIAKDKGQSWPLGLFLFEGPLYLYATVLCALTARHYHRIRQNEEAVPTRLRFGLSLLVAALASAYFGVRAVVTTLNLILPGLGLKGLLNLNKLLLVTSGLLWPWALASNVLYRLAARLLTFRDKALALRDLQRLRARLDRLCPSSSPVPAQPRWWLRLWDLDLGLYWAVIGILDGRKLLAAGLAGEIERVTWDETERREAEDLHRALEHFPTAPDFDRLVLAYRDLARQLARG